MIHPSSKFTVFNKRVAIFEHSIKNRLNQVFTVSRLTRGVVKKS